MMRQIVAYGIRDMAETIAAQMLAAIPAGHDDDMIVQPGALQHLQNQRPRAAFAVIVLDRLSSRIAAQL